MLHSTTKDWTILTNLYNLPFWTTLQSPCLNKKTSTNIWWFKFLVVSVSCLIPWLNCTFRLHCNSSYNNCSHTNSINNWSMWVLSETTRVWKDDANSLKMWMSNFHKKLDDQCLSIDMQSLEAHQYELALRCPPPY